MMSVAGLVDAEVVTIHALGGRCRGCRGDGGCARSVRARQSLAEWADTRRVRAGLARYMLHLSEVEWEGTSGAGDGDGSLLC